MSNWMKYTAEQPQSHGELFDVCKNRHRGNPESEAAFQSISDGLSTKQRCVLMLISRMPGGATLDEICLALNKTPNAISGRITELKIMGKIKKIGTRPTRSGCSAAVWKAV